MMKGPSTASSIVSRISELYISDTVTSFQAGRPVVRIHAGVQRQITAVKGLSVAEATGGAKVDQKLPLHWKGRVPGEGMATTGLPVILPPPDSTGTGHTQELRHSFRREVSAANKHPSNAGMYIREFDIATLKVLWSSLRFCGEMT